MATEITDKLQELHLKLIDCLNTVNLGVAGRIIYYDKEYNMFILAVHSTSPKEAQEVGGIALEAIRDNILPELDEAGIGFACKQI